MRRALGFLTPLPLAGRDGARPTARTFGWFPGAGLLIGATVGGVWWAAGRLWAAPVAAALFVVADAAATGMLHLDGLADSADGLLPHLDRERRLAVMHAPDIGAFGVVVLGLVLLCRFAAATQFGAAPLASAAGWTVVLAVAALWCASRSVMALAACHVAYARADRGGGLASAFGRGDDDPGRGTTVACGVGLAGSVALAAVATAPAAGIGHWWVGPLAVATLVVGAGAVVALGVRRLGGYTGDVLGAAGVVGETVGLLVLVAKW